MKTATESVSVERTYLFGHIKLQRAKEAYVEYELQRYYIVYKHKSKVEDLLEAAMNHTPEYRAKAIKNL